MEPTPPPEGWTLREAAEALCPDAARLHAEGGEPLDAALRDSMNEWAGLLDPAPDLWLADRLREALAARPDLRLTGRDLAQGIAAPRLTVPADVLRLTATTNGRRHVYLDLDLAGDAARISYSFETARPDHPSDVELMAVRVEAIRVQADAPPTVTRAPEPPRTWLRGNAGISATERAKWTAPPSPPTTALPDPRRNPWLSVDDALCWIAFRGCPVPDDETARAENLHAAERDLVAAAAAGRIPAKGEEGTRDSPHPGVMPGTIPPDAFAKHEAGLSILGGGRLGLRHFAPISAILDYAGPYFHHVRFDAAAILAEWPEAAPARSAAAPPPKLSDMPARWALLEALAWIMFRDTRTVQGASLEMPREATTYWAETRLPGGDAELVPVMGEPGSGRLRLSLEWAYDRAQGTPTNGLAPDAAENDLLAKLRSGAIIARGRLATDATPRTMDPGDWRGLALVERTRGDVAAEPQGATGQAWREISVARDDVVNQWPLRGTTSETAAGTSRNTSDSLPATPADIWMRSNVTRPGQRKRDAAIRDCRDATGCTHRAALAAWNALPPELKGTRGRPGKPAS